MKKILVLVLALILALGSFAALAEAVDPATIEDTITSEDGTYAVAFVTDVGALKDKSFNEGTWNGVKAYAAANGLTYKYYQPANGDQATDDDRFDAMKAAAEAGAQCIVCAGFMQGTALAQAAAAYPDVKFVFIDGWAMSDLTNTLGVAFKEEQCGYFAGYAVVREGFEHLGFSGGGGGDNPACCRYGYGFIQGANDAAAEMGKTVDMKFTWAYGASFQASPELQTLVSGWYETGTDIVFSCGGSIFSSITAAAAANDCYVIGVDVDQSFDSDTVVTSALKGITEATAWACAKAFDGTWDEVGGGAVSLGAADNAVGLPTETWSMENFTVEEYEAMKAAVAAGEIVIDDAAANGDPNQKGPWENVTVDYVE